MLWQCWKPAKTLDKYTLDDQWICYDTGERMLNAAGVSTGMKPPLRKVEMYFGASWRKEPAVSFNSFLMFTCHWPKLPFYS